MKRTIEISASFTGKISTGSFENESPYFAAKETIELDEITALAANDMINIRQKELHSICYEQFKRHAEIAYQEKIAKTYKNIRFYDGKEGIKYPSVTSIINMDETFMVSADELAQYAARGTVIHKQVEVFLKTGEWKAPKDIPDIAFEVMTVLKGSLNLQLDDVSFVNFFKDYPFKVLECEKTVISDTFRYGGRLDLLCIIESQNKGNWGKIEGILFDVPTILDIKTGSLDKTKGFTQQAAYAKTDESIKQIGLIHLNKENVCGYSKPVLSNKIDSYWDIFIKQRRLFEERYGV